MEVSFYQERLQELRNKVNQIPDSANPIEIWGHFGWSEEASLKYKQYKELGIDIRPFISRDFSDLVAIVADSELGFPYKPNMFTWQEILEGFEDAFPGDSPKERMLAVLNAAMRNCLNS